MSHSSQTLSVLIFVNIKNNSIGCLCVWVYPCLFVCVLSLTACTLVQFSSVLSLSFTNMLKTWDLSRPSDSDWLWLNVGNYVKSWRHLSVQRCTFQKLSSLCAFHQSWNAALCHIIHYDRVNGCSLRQLNISSIAVLGALRFIHMRSSSSCSYPKEHVRLSTISVYIQ